MCSSMMVPAHAAAHAGECFGEAALGDDVYGGIRRESVVVKGFLVRHSRRASPMPVCGACVPHCCRLSHVVTLNAALRLHLTRGLRAC